MEKDKLFEVIISLQDKVNQVSIDQERNANKLLSLEEFKASRNKKLKIILGLLVFSSLVLLFSWSELVIINDNLQILIKQHD